MCMYIHTYICIYDRTPIVSGKVLETLADPFSLPLLCEFGPLKELSVTVFSPVKWVDRILIQALYIKHLAQF